MKNAILRIDPVWEKWRYNGINWVKGTFDKDFNDDNSRTSQQEYRRKKKSCDNFPTNFMAEK